MEVLEERELLLKGLQRELAGASDLLNRWSGCERWFAQVELGPVNADEGADRRRGRGRL